MVKGGYQIINFDGVEFRTGISMQCEGLYEKIEGTRKAILLSGLTVDGKEYHDVYINPQIFTYSFLFDCGDFILDISDRDICTVYPKNIHLGYDGVAANIVGDPFVISANNAKAFKYAVLNYNYFDFRITMNERDTTEVYHGKIVGMDDSEHNAVIVTNLGVLSITIDNNIVTINKVN